MATWELDGTLKIPNPDNSREYLVLSEYDLTGSFSSRGAQDGILASGSGYSEISMLPITTAKLVEIKLDTEINVRLNNTLILANCTRVLLTADITKIEIEKQAAATVAYYAQFLA